MTLGSLFDGIGGFPLAASRYGITPIWASEIEPSCVSITKRHFTEMRHLGDITQIKGADIEPADIISFGSPCQDLSVAGNRAGMAGARSGLFKEAIRIINEMREETHDRYPTWAIWENVPGALSSNDGLDFRAVLESIAGSEIPMPDSGRWASAGMVRGGCCDIGWRILDAQFWGVPQRRRRIFLVADFRGRRAAEVLFKPESLRRNYTQGPAAGKGFARCAGGGAPDTNGVGLTNRGVVSGNVTETVRAGCHGAIPMTAIWPDVARTLAARHDSSPCVDRGQNFVISAFGETGQGYWQDGVQTIRAEGESRPSRPGNVVVGTEYLTEWDKQSRRVFSPNGVSPTILGCDGGGGRNPGGLLFESHGQDSRVTGPHNVSPTASRKWGTGGDNTPLVVAGFMAGQGDKAGGIGYQEEVSPTLKADSGGNTIPSVLCVQNNTIGRNGNNGAGGKGIQQDIAYTLDTREPHAVCVRTAQTNSNGIGVCADLAYVLDIGEPCAVLFPAITGTLRKSGSGTERVDGHRGELGFCVCVAHGQAGAEIGNDVSPTLNCNHEQPYIAGSVNTVRRLMPIECERLQGFPDDWTAQGHDCKPISDSKRYSAIGNSVAVPCVEYIMAGIVDESYERT